MDLAHLHPRALLRSLFLLGLAGWAAIAASLFGMLLVLKVAAWRSVGWFVDQQGGGFRVFGFMTDTAGTRELLGVWSLPLFAGLTAVLGWLAISGARSGLRPLREPRSSPSTYSAA